MYIFTFQYLNVYASHWVGIKLSKTGVKIIEDSYISENYRGWKVMDGCSTLHGIYKGLLTYYTLRSFIILYKGLLCYMIIHHTYIKGYLLFRRLFRS